MPKASPPVPPLVSAVNVAPLDTGNPNWLGIPIERLTWKDIPPAFREGGKAVVILALREMPYEEYLQTNHWQDVRRDALKRAKYRCVVCLTKKRLDVHHIDYSRRGFEEPEDVAVLCRDDHKIQHEILRKVWNEELSRRLS